MDLLVATSREADALRQELRRLLVATGHSKAEHMLSRRRLDMRALETYDDEKAFALFQRFARNGTWQCPTIVNMQVTTYSELAQLTSDARLKYVPSWLQQNWREAFNNVVVRIDPLEQRKRRVQNRIRMTGMMQRAGTGILAGTDAGVPPFNYPGFTCISPVQDYCPDSLCVGDVIERVGIQQNQIGNLALFNCAEVLLLAEEPSRVDGRCLECWQWRETRLHEQLQLTMHISRQNLWRICSTMRNEQPESRS